MRKFNPTSAQPARAVQAWQILVGLATNRRTITYGGLSELMFRKKAAGVLGKIVGNIAYICLDNNIPQLNAIVVGKGRGTPGEEIPLKPDEVDEMRERVYEYDWFGIYPPSEQEMRAAWAAHRPTEPAL